MKKEGLVVLVVSFLLSTAHATIVYSGTVNETCNAFSEATLNVDFNQDGNIDALLGWVQVGPGDQSVQYTMGLGADLGFNTLGIQTQFLNLPISCSSPLPGAPIPLNEGDLIGQQAIGNSLWSYTSNQKMLLTDIVIYPLYISVDCTGPWHNLTGKYLGCKFKIGSSDYYGWIQLSVDPFNNATLVDFAYENNPNTAIAAGAIPEPATLLLLGLGGIAFRKRK